MLDKVLHCRPDVGRREQAPAVQPVLVIVVAGLIVGADSRPQSRPQPRDVQVVDRAERQPAVSQGLLDDRHAGRRECAREQRGRVRSKVRFGPADDRYHEGCRIGPRGLAGHWRGGRCRRGGRGCCRAAVEQDELAGPAVRPDRGEREPAMPDRGGDLVAYLDQDVPGHLEINAQEEQPSPGAALRRWVEVVLDQLDVRVAGRVGHQARAYRHVVVTLGVGMVGEHGHAADGPHRRGKVNHRVIPRSPAAPAAAPEPSYWRSPTAAPRAHRWSGTPSFGTGTAIRGRGAW